ncbi:MAG: glycoside hydrolase family 25 protein, partial [Oscillospiraceae bacterium]|nr:glycoside hydrolase family 25 protein [Oscillospiraceae bacterium]
EESGYVAKGYVKSLNANITRMEMAKLLAAYLEIEGIKMEESPFADTSDSVVLALYEKGIIEGSIENGQRLFKGKDYIKRSEICKELCLSMDYVAENFVIVAGNRAPINFNLEMSSYDKSLFRTEGDRIYYDDSENIPRYGIDVSAYQGVIDWEKAKADGVEFAIIRLGYRGYTAGAIQDDPNFEANIKGAIEAGVEVGIYFFSQAINTAEAIEEANYVLAKIEGYDVSWPVVFDWEPLYYYGSRTAKYSGKTVSDCAIAFMDTVMAAGYDTMMYYNKSLAYLHLDLERLESYDTWLAQYAVSAPDYIYAFDMWQYGTAEIDGIEGPVDVNIAFKNYNE